MNRQGMRAVVCGVGVLLLGMAASAQPDAAPAVPIEVLELQNIELGEVAGKRASVVRVTFAPGAASPPHRHPGTVLVYVLEGEIRSALDDQTAQIYRAGDSWTEPVGALHRVAVNATDKRAVLLAVLLHDAEAPLQRPAE